MANMATTAKCIKLSYVHVSLCDFGGFQSNYSAGAGKLPLIGSVLPKDNRWDGHVFTLTGYLVEQNGCLMMMVTKATPCGTPAVM
jgi:hypothetical protein